MDPWSTTSGGGGGGGGGQLEEMISPFSPTCTMGGGGALTKTMEEPLVGDPTSDRWEDEPQSMGVEHVGLELNQKKSSGCGF